LSTDTGPGSHLPALLWAGWIVSSIPMFTARTTHGKNPTAPIFSTPVATYIAGKGMNYYFRGSIRSTITMLEYDVYKKYFPIEPIQAYYWIPEKEINYIYRPIIHKLYDLKSTYKTGDQNFYKLTKILMNGFYGKLIQKTRKVKNGKIRWETGQLFNPYHGSYVTARCRTEVFKYIQESVYPEDVIAVMTDSVATTRPPYYKRADRFGKKTGAMVT
jgi:hypothetical protein